MRAFLRTVLVCGGAAAVAACSALGSALDRFTGGDAGTDAGAGAACAGAACAAACPSPLAECDGRCVDTDTDERNCGDCGVVCPPGRTCAAGTCALQCPPLQTACGGACVDTSIHVGHCGGCDQACAKGEACVDGACKVVCVEGQRPCDGRCTDTSTDNAHCGKCGTACAPGLVCSAGACAISCAPGLHECDGRCVDRQTNGSHCGRCGRACKANQTCEGGSCVLSCEAGLDEPVTDAWGYAWDGLERGAAAYAQAEKVCTDLGGRLPTATELFRVSASQSSSVGQTYDTNYLWSIVPHDATLQHAVRLSDGGSVAQDLATALTYRCVCPEGVGRVGFSGDSCNGPPGDECMALASGNAKTDVDRRDRAAVSKAGAIWECAFHDAHLAPIHALVEAIDEGAAGSNVWLHTADDAEHRYDTLLRWDGTPGIMWAPAQGTTLSYGNTRDLRPFRCAGSSGDTGTYPADVANGWAAPKDRGFESEQNDTMTSSGAGYADAIGACWNRGGHLPTSAELAELIQAGLPNGGGAWVWTADDTGYNPNGQVNFLNVVLKWDGTDLRFAYADPNSMTWAWKTGTDIPYRCVYYPVDADYAGPAESACAGGCVEIALPGSSGARLWFDDTDRVASSWEAAADVCRQEGGRLPHERDLAEAIRQGLANGSGMWLWTTDLGVGGVGSLAVNAMVVAWSGQDAAFTDQYSTYMTWSGFGTARPFRCAWGNEAR